MEKLKKLLENDESPRDRFLGLALSITADRQAYKRESVEEFLDFLYSKVGSAQMDRVLVDYLEQAGL